MSVDRDDTKLDIRQTRRNPRTQNEPQPFLIDTYINTEN